MSTVEIRTSYMRSETMKPLAETFEDPLKAPPPPPYQKQTSSQLQVL